MIKNCYKNWIYKTSLFLFIFDFISVTGDFVFTGVTHKSYGINGRFWIDLVVSKEFINDSAEDELVSCLSSMMPTDAEILAKEKEDD